MTTRNAPAIDARRISKPSRGSVRITPCPTTQCRRPSLSMTPHPVRSVPQSMPKTRMGGYLVPLIEARLPGKRLQFLLVDIKIGVYVLYIVMLLKGFVESQHAARVLAFKTHQILRNHGDLGGFSGETG